MKKPKPKRKPVAYLPPGIYAIGLLSLLYPDHTVIVTKKWKMPKGQRIPARKARHGK